MRELGAVAVDEAAVGECEATGTGGELVGGDLVLEVMERDPPTGVALGEGTVGEPGKQPSGVSGTTARRLPKGAHRVGRDATAAGEHGELTVTVLIGVGKIANAKGDRGKNTGVLVSVRPVRVRDRIDVGALKQVHHVLPVPRMGATGFDHAPDQRYAQREVPDPQAQAVRNGRSPVEVGFSPAAQQSQGLLERQLVHFPLGGANGTGDATVADGEQQRAPRRADHIERIEGLSIPDVVDDEQERSTGKQLGKAVTAYLGGRERNRLASEPGGEALLQLRWCRLLAGIDPGDPVAKDAPHGRGVCDRGCQDRLAGAAHADQADGAVRNNVVAHRVEDVGPGDVP